jgi:hypothetical protein
MIIYINATVCGGMARMKDWQFMIIWSGPRRRAQRGREAAMTRRSGNFKLRTENDGS